MTEDELEVAALRGPRRQRPPELRQRLLRRLLAVLQSNNIKAINHTEVAHVFYALHSRLLEVQHDV